jgi:hypothetical protein
MVFGHLKNYFRNGGALYSPDDILVVELASPQRFPMSPIEEAMLAAQHIAESAKEPLFLCLNGGIDSLAMAEAFFRAKVPFTAAIFKFKNYLNGYDIKYAIRFCEARGIRYTVFPIDIARFCEDGRYFELAHRYRCRSPRVAVQIEGMSKIPGVPILSWEPPIPRIDPAGTLHLSVPNDHSFAVQRYLEGEQRPGIPFFFLYSPELFYSFIHLPLMQEALFEKGIRVSEYDPRVFKAKLYRQGGFELSFGTRSHGDGFERVRTAFQGKQKTSVPTYDRLFLIPLLETYPEPRYLIQLDRSALKPV